MEGGYSLGLIRQLTVPMICKKQAVDSKKRKVELGFFMRISRGRKRQKSSWNQFKQYERPDKKAAIDDSRSHKSPTALRSKGKRDNKS